MISIVIPVYNEHETTNECITSIRMNTEDCEIIIIDNGSTPAFTKPYTGFIPCHVIRNDINEGFPIAVNQGIIEASGDIVVLLNNDTIVTPGWADMLVNALDEFDIVGPVCNNCAGMQKVYADPYENIDELNKVAFGWSENYKGYKVEVNWIIGVCMMFKKSVFDDVGEFDESLWPCSGEELDWCFRAREKDYRVGIVYDCYIHHHGSRTFKTMDNEGELKYKEIVDRNNEHLAEKWGEDFWHRQDITSFRKPKGICLNLGCGYRKLKDFINIDNREDVQPDLFCDVVEGLPYDDDSVDMIRAYDFLEHIHMDKVIDVITEIWRVLKPDGIFEASTPSTDGRGAFQDPTHRSFWNQNSWLYYTDPYHRSLYSIRADFKVDSIEDNSDPHIPGVIHTHSILRKR